MLANVVENIVVCSRTGSEINEVVEHIKEINNGVNVLGERCDEDMNQYMFGEEEEGSDMIEEIDNQLEEDREGPVSTILNVIN